MAMKFVYRKQENEYFCGPAVVQTILGYFGKKMSQRRLAILLKTNARTGTSTTALVRGIRNFGFHATAHYQGSLEEIRHSLRQHIPVMVNYQEPEKNEGHFALVVGFSRSSIFLHDPWHGPKFRVSLSYFMSHWHGQYERQGKQWLMAVAKKLL